MMTNELNLYHNERRIAHWRLSARLLVSLAFLVATLGLLGLVTAAQPIVEPLEGVNSKARDADSARYAAMGSYYEAQNERIAAASAERYAAMAAVYGFNAKARAADSARYAALGEFYGVQNAPAAVTDLADDPAKGAWSLAEAEHITAKTDWSGLEDDPVKGAWSSAEAAYHAARSGSAVVAGRAADYEAATASLERDTAEGSAASPGTVIASRAADYKAVTASLMRDSERSSVASDAAFLAANPELIKVRRFQETSAGEDSIPNVLCCADLP